METLKKTVLIFDDDETILAACKHILTRDGWTVHTSEDVRNLVEKTAQAGPDVILMDNWIPDTDGIVATRTLKNTPAFRHIPVIYFSANSDVASLAQSAGADAFLAKPFSLKELVRVVNSFLVGVKNTIDEPAQQKK